MAGNQIIIRAYRAEDAARVREITVEGFLPVSVEAAIDRRWPALLPATWDERKWQAMQAELAAHPEHCFVAEGEGRVVGYVTTSIVAEHATGRIPDLAVDRTVQGGGIGRRLLEHALAHFRARGVKVAKIETLAHNAVGRHLYPSVGFQEIATQVHYAMALDEAAEPQSSPSAASMTSRASPPREPSF